MKKDKEIETRSSAISKKMCISTSSALPPLPLQLIWYEMKHLRKWRSMALVPVTNDIQTLGLAHGIGLMAVRELYDIVWVVNASSAKRDDAPPGFEHGFSPDDNAFPYKYVDLTKLDIDGEKQLIAAKHMLEELSEQEHVKMSFIFTVDAITSNPHSIPLCHTVDAVILCMALEKTSFKIARRTMEIIGRDRILGSILLRPATKGNLHQLK